jgi:hypothetical protein
MLLLLVFIEDNIEKKRIFTLEIITSILYENLCQNNMSYF